MKAGTTTLMKYLVNNPAISIPDGEVHFFDNSYNNKKGYNWYRDQFIIDDDTIITGEKTPTYSFKPGIPEKIFKFNPEVKLIWMLRNPVNRSFSNYLHAVRNGSEKNSFEEAIQKERQGLNENIYKNYLKRSIYSDQIRRFLKFFPMKNMHFIIFEEFIKDPQKELQKLYFFLNIPYAKKSNEPNQTIKANKSYLPFSINIQYYSRRLFGRSKIFQIINYFNCLYPSRKPQIKEDIKDELYNYFIEYNKELNNLIDKDISIWTLER